MVLCIGCGKDFKQISRHAPYCQKTDSKISNVRRGVAEEKAAARVREKLKRREEKRRAQALQEGDDRAAEARAQVRRTNLLRDQTSEYIHYADRT